MLPLSDGIPARRFPLVNVAIIVANFCVWLFYELPQLNSAVYHASFYPARDYRTHRKASTQHVRRRGEASRTGERRIL